MGMRRKQGDWGVRNEKGDEIGEARVLWGHPVGVSPMQCGNGDTYEWRFLKGLFA